jgi:hypothetical protein
MNFERDRLPFADRISKNIILRLRSFALFFSLVCVITSSVACSQSTNPADGGEKMTHVMTTDTPYYLSGPQQAHPPDGTLKAGTQIIVVESQGSYSLVRTKDGVKGHVDNNSFKPLTQ